MHINVMHVEVRGQHMGGQLLLWYGSQELRGLWLGGEVLFALFCFCKCLEQLIGPISYFFFFFLKQALCWTLSSLILTLTDGVSCRHPCPCCHPHIHCPVLRLQMFTSVLGFYMALGEPSSGSHTQQHVISWANPHLLHVSIIKAIVGCRCITSAWILLSAQGLARKHRLCLIICWSQAKWESSQMVMTFHVSAGKWSWVFWKSSQCSRLPSHLSSPFKVFLYVCMFFRKLLQ